VLDNAKMKNPRTADLIKSLGKLGWGKALLIDGNELDNNFQLAARNVIGLNVLPSQGANVYDILRSDTLVLTKDAIEKLVERLK
jgi:large subunit ribosomal protein L4